MVGFGFVEVLSYMRSFMDVLLQHLQVVKLTSPDAVQLYDGSSWQKVNTLEKHVDT